MPPRQSRSQADMRNVTEAQQRLIALGYLAPLDENGKSNADGKFGQRSMDAYNHYRATKGLPPVQQTTMADLNAVLFPEEQAAVTAPTRKPGALDWLALFFSLSTSKGKPMSWDTVQQIIRIGLYSGGSFFFGQQVADGNLYQAAIGGVLAIGAFAWWLVFERNRTTNS